MNFIREYLSNWFHCLKETPASEPAPTHNVGKVVALLHLDNKPLPIKVTVTGKVIDSVFGDGVKYAIKASTLFNRLIERPFILADHGMMYPLSRVRSMDVESTDYIVNDDGTPLPDQGPSVDAEITFGDGDGGCDNDMPVKLDFS